MNRSIVIDGRYIQDHFPGIGRYTFNLVDALASVAQNERFSLLFNPAVKNSHHDLGSLARYGNLDLVPLNVPTVSLSEQFQMRMTGQLLFHSPFFIKPYFVRVPSAVTIYDLIPLRVSNSASPVRKLIFRFGIMLAIQTSMRVIVPSAAACTDLVELFGTARDKLAITPLAADGRFKMLGERERERVRSKYALAKNYILYVGINKPHKNLGTLIKAYHSASVDADLVIAGAWDSRYGADLESPRPRVRLIRNVEDADLPGLYSGATLFVLPSLYEGFGLPLLEAMACGAPCIASTAASLREIGDDAALYFDPRDSGSLAQLISQVVCDPAERDSMRGKSIARAGEFSWERTARSTLAIYGQVANLERQDIKPSGLTREP